MRKHKAKLSLLASDIKPVVRQLSKSNRNTHPEIWARWIEILGKDLAARAVPRSWKDGRLIMAVSSSAWMQELSFLKTELIDRFEEELGPDVVTEIKLVCDSTISIDDF